MQTHAAAAAYLQLLVWGGGICMAMGPAQCAMAHLLAGKAPTLGGLRSFQPRSRSARSPFFWLQRWQHATWRARTMGG